MKPKKKLVYKLQNNVQQNPFKAVQPKNLRHNGSHSYDFAKLRSYKAFSSNCLYNNQSNILKQKQSTSITEKQLDLRQETRKYMIQNIEGNKQLAYEQAVFIKKKSLQLKNKLKETQKKQKKQLCSDDELNSKLIKEIVHQKLMSIKKRYENSQNQITNDNKKQKKRSSDFVLPQIKSKIIQQIFEPFSTENHINQLKAKEYLMKQIQNIKQFQKNKIILESIKKKSNKNLQKLPRSQSEVLKNDKWKEKYSLNQPKKKNYFKLKAQQKNQENNEIMSKIDSIYWTKTTNEDDQQNKLKQNQIDLRKKLQTYKQFCQVQVFNKRKISEIKPLENYQQRTRILEQELSSNFQNKIKVLQILTKQKNQKEEKNQIQQASSNYQNQNQNLNNASLKILNDFQTSQTIVKKTSLPNQLNKFQKQEQIKEENNKINRQCLNKTEFKTYYNQQSEKQKKILKQNSQSKQTRTQEKTKIKQKNMSKPQKQYIQYKDRLFSKLIQQIPMKWQSTPQQMLEQDYDFGQFQDIKL